MVDLEALREARQEWGVGMVVAAGSQDGNPQGKAKWAITMRDGIDEVLDAPVVRWCETHGCSSDPAFDHEHCWEWTTGEEGELVKPPCSMVPMALVRIGDDT